MEKLWYDLGVSCEQALLYIYIYISFGSRLFTTASLPTSWRRVCLPIKEMLRFIDSVHYSKLSLVILNTANVLSVLLEQMAIQNDHNSYCFMNLSLFFFTSFSRLFMKTHRPCGYSGFSSPCLCFQSFFTPHPSRCYTAPLAAVINLHFLFISITSIR